MTIEWESFWVYGVGGVCRGGEKRDRRPVTGIQLLGFQSVSVVFLILATSAFLGWADLVSYITNRILEHVSKLLSVKLEKCCLPSPSQKLS